MVRASGLGICLCLCCATVAAQQIPPTAQPGAIERERQQPRQPRSTSPLPGVTFKEELPQAPPGADTTTFTLQSLDVSGNVVLSDDVLLGPYRAEIGKTISVQRVYEIAAGMTAVYRDAGYVLSAVVVPAQAIAEGKVSLSAVEGYLSAVSVEGYKGRRDGMVEAIGRDLTSEKPLRLATLERNLLLLNDLPGITAQGVLQRSATEPGGSDLTIRLARQATGFDAGVNNRGSEVQGPVRYEGGLTLNSLFGLFGETRFSFLAADPTSELKYGFISHTSRLTASGLDLRVYASKSRAEPELGVDFQDFNLETDTDQVGAELKYPIIRSRERNLYARGALTYHDGATDSTFPEEVTRDVISALRAGLTWDQVDRWNGVNIVDWEFAQGIDAFGASDEGDPQLSRDGGRPDFTKTTLYLARLQSLGSGWSILLAGSGQYAFTNLLSPEEFAFGGEPFGRAYDSSELVGDSGAAGKLELRYTFDALGRGGLTTYGFYDTGRVWRRLGPNERQGECSAFDQSACEEDGASAYGGGLRFTLSSWLTGYVEIAVPIDQIVVAEGDDDPRYFAGLRVQFGSAQLE